MVRIGFESFDPENATIKQAVMSMASRGEYYHCEIVFSDGAVGSAHDQRRGVTLSNVADRNYLNDWLFFKVPCSVEQEKQIRNYFVEHQQKRYNWTGIIGSMVAGFNITSGFGKFCSECCFEALLFAGVIKDYGFIASELSPNDLLLLIQKLKWQELSA